MLVAGTNVVIKISSAHSSEKKAMVPLQVPEPNSTLVKLHDYCKQHCTFSDYISFTVGRGQQLLSALPTTSILIKVKLMPPWFTLVVQGIIYSGNNILPF